MIKHFLYLSVKYIIFSIYLLCPAIKKVICAIQNFPKSYIVLRFLSKSWGPHWETFTGAGLTQQRSSPCLWPAGVWWPRPGGQRESGDQGLVASGSLVTKAWCQWEPGHQGLVASWNQGGCAKTELGSALNTNPWADKGNCGTREWGPHKSWGGYGQRGGRGWVLCVSQIQTSLHGTLLCHLGRPITFFFWKLSRCTTTGPQKRWLLR